MWQRNPSNPAGQEHSKLKKKIENFKGFRCCHTKYAKDLKKSGWVLSGYLPILTFVYHKFRTETVDLLPLKIAFSSWCHIRRTHPKLKGIFKDLKINEIVIDKPYPSPVPNQDAKNLKYNVDE